MFGDPLRQYLEQCQRQAHLARPIQGLPVDSLGEMMSTIRHVNPDAHKHLMARVYKMTKETYEAMEPLVFEAAKNGVFNGKPVQ